MLLEIQRHFHAVILERAAERTQYSTLPDLAPLLLSEEPIDWFHVPGMYGGFNYWLVGEGEQTKLITESWSRVVDGSGQRHENTAAGIRLIDSGFVQR
ncbi:MAG: hypothetical protein WKF92_08300 [Pyrinomonadaceae bacterium]